MFRQEQEGNFSCPPFCMGNLETGGGLCISGSLPGASASSSSGVSILFSVSPSCPQFLPPPSFPLSRVSPTSLLFCFLWHLAHALPVTSVPILLSAITLMPRPPAERPLHPWWFGFLFQLRSGSLASRPGTAPSRPRQSFTVVAEDF